MHSLDWSWKRLSAKKVHPYFSPRDQHTQPQNHSMPQNSYIRGSQRKIAHVQGSIYCKYVHVDFVCLIYTWHRSLLRSEQRSLLKCWDFLKNIEHTKPRLCIILLFNPEMAGQAHKNFLKKYLPSLNLIYKVYLARWSCKLSNNEACITCQILLHRTRNMCILQYYC